MGPLYPYVPRRKARPAPLAGVEPMAEFFVSTPAAGPYQPAGWRLPNSCRFAVGELHSELVGGAVLAFDNEEDKRDRKRKAGSAANDDSSSERSPPSRPRGRTGAPGVGNALREAYQEALREEVPPEMLDLLGKLG